MWRVTFIKRIAPFGKHCAPVVHVAAKINISLYEPECNEKARYTYTPNTYDLHLTERLIETVIMTMPPCLTRAKIKRDSSSTHYLSVYNNDMNCIIMEYRLTDQFGRYVRRRSSCGAQYFIDFVLFIVPLLAVKTENGVEYGWRVRCISA